MALFVSVFTQDSIEYSGNNNDPRDGLWLKRRSYAKRRNVDEERRNREGFSLHLLTL